jgi:NAD+ kinase
VTASSATVALVVNASRPRAVELAAEAAVWLAARGHVVRLPKKDAQAVGLDEHAAEPDELEAGVDLVAALGGDGTILRAVHLAAPQGAPVLGVNLGRLAYLSTVEPDFLCAALERFLAGEHEIESRAMLCVTVEGRAATLALNEAVLEHVGAGHTVHFAVSISGRFFNSYVADAVILATPTGSTAYSFSAGGPIVSPRQRALLLTPVAPHTPFSRTLVLDPSDHVGVEVLEHRGATLSVDGVDLGQLAQGESMTVDIAPVDARLVTFGERDFYGLLKAKFGLADR